MRAVGVGVDGELRKKATTTQAAYRAVPRAGYSSPEDHLHAPARGASVRLRESMCRVVLTVWGGARLMTPPNPSRRRLTQAEWDAELQRAKDVQAAAYERFVVGRSKPLRTRTGRRRSWWQRGWKR